MALAKTFLQSMKSGSQPIKELYTDFNLYTGEVPFRVDAKAKQLPKNSWYDEHGDEEFIPDNLMLESYDMTFQIGYKGNFQTAAAKIRTFIEYLRTAKEMKVYCDYNDIGRQKVRFVSISKPITEVSNEGEGDIYVWNITLKVNDPYTSIKITK